MMSRKLIDIGANLCDSMFSGIYNGSNKHAPDLDKVLERATSAGVQSIIVTSGSLEECRKSLQLIKEKKFETMLTTTAGCHPTRCLEIWDQPDKGVQYLNDLHRLVQDNSELIVAIGEMGLDYDRIQFCPKDVQLRCFEQQLELVEKTKKPMFLHCRNSADDLYEVLRRNASRLYGGVVHSFDGSLEEANRFIDLGYLIGLNGCSLRTDANLEVVRQLSLDKLLLETDSPWCEIRPTHSSFKYVQTVLPSKKKEKFESGQLVKGRNEPCNLKQVLEVVAAIHQLPVETVEEAVYRNTIQLFPSLAGLV